MKTIQEAGRCPKCGSSKINYGDSSPDGESIGYHFTCDVCKTEATEWYDLTYSETNIDE